MAVTRLSGGLTPANGSDPRTFPAIWNATADDIEAAEAGIAAIGANNWVTTARINDGAVTAPKLATTAGAVMVFDDATARGSAIPSPVEGMVTYLNDDNLLYKYDGSAWVNAAPQKILQVVSTTKTSTFSTTSSSFVTVTGLTATITPSSTSSKILIMAQIAYGTAQGNFKLAGGNTSSYIGDSEGSRTRVVFGGVQNIGGELARIMISSSIVYLDSPATTSATTYEVQARLTNDVCYVNRPFLDANTLDITRGASSITVMEVAA